MKKILIVLLLGFACFSFAKNKYYQGYFCEKDNIKLFNYPVYDLNDNKVKLKDIFTNKNKNYYVCFCSPYSCANCEIENIHLVNSIFKQYPKQVILIVSDWYKKETLKYIKNNYYDKNIKVYLDKKSKNINEFRKLNPNFIDEWHFISNVNNKLLFMRAVSYSIDVSVKNKQRNLNKINKLLNN